MVATLDLATKDLTDTIVHADGLEYTQRPAIFADVPDEKWNSWQWQLKSVYRDPWT